MDELDDFFAPPPLLNLQVTSSIKATVLDSQEKGLINDGILSLEPSSTVNHSSQAQNSSENEINTQVIRDEIVQSHQVKSSSDNTTTTNHNFVPSMIQEQSPRIVESSNIANSTPTDTSIQNAISIEPHETIPIENQHPIKTQNQVDDNHIPPKTHQIASENQPQRKGRKPIPNQKLNTNTAVPRKRKLENAKKTQNKKEDNSKRGHASKKDNSSDKKTGQMIESGQNEESSSDENILFVSDVADGGRPELPKKAHTQEKELQTKPAQSKKPNLDNGKKKHTQGHKKGNHNKSGKDEPPTPKVLCKFYANGVCRLGNTCTFLHQGEPKRFDEICKFFRTGHCTKGDACPFSHDLKRELCKYFYELNFCRLGDACPYSHDPSSGALPPTKPTSMAVDEEQIAQQQEAQLQRPLSDGPISNSSASQNWSALSPLEYFKLQAQLTQQPNIAS